MVKAYIINLKRQPYRLSYMKKNVPPELNPEFTTDWDIPMDGQSIDLSEFMKKYNIFPNYAILGLNQNWNRPVKMGEVGNGVAHWHCWLAASQEQNDDTFVFLEDDVILPEHFYEILIEKLQHLSIVDPNWGLLYLGQSVPYDNQENPVEGFHKPHYIYCTYAYALSRLGIEKIIQTRFDQAIIPTDEFIPAMYIDHPRTDIRERYPKQFTAYGMQANLVRRVPSSIVGSDTQVEVFATQSKFSKWMFNYIRPALKSIYQRLPEKTRLRIYRFRMRHKIHIPFLT